MSNPEHKTINLNPHTKEEKREAQESWAELYRAYKPEYERLLQNVKDAEANLRYAERKLRNFNRGSWEFIKEHGERAIKEMSE